MPVDKNIDDEDVAKESGEDLSTLGSKRRFNEFDCPDCTANNPSDDGFGDGEEVTCNYCGQEYKVVVRDDGRLKLTTS